MFDSFNWPSAAQQVGQGLAVALLPPEVTRVPRSVGVDVGRETPTVLAIGIREPPLLSERRPCVANAFGNRPLFHHRTETAATAAAVAVILGLVGL